MSVLIARRIFDLIKDDGSADTVVIELDLPEQDPDDPQTWLCHLQVELPERNYARTAFGADSLQALMTAIRFLRLEVEALKLLYPGRITLFGGTNLAVGAPDRTDESS